MRHVWGASLMFRDGTVACFVSKVSGLQTDNDMD